MANLTIKQTAESASLIAEMCALFAGETPERALKDCTAAFRNMPDAFNALRAAINAANADLKVYMEVYSGFLKTYGHSLGIGVSARLTAVGLTGKDLDDDSQFVAALKGVGELTDLRAKMRTCIAMNDQLAQSVRGWQSKLDKLGERKGLAGSTEAEIAIVERKEYAVREIIERLHRRGDAVSQVYYACKRELEMFVAASDIAFKPMFANDRVRKGRGE